MDNCKPCVSNIGFDCRGALLSCRIAGTLLLDFQGWASRVFMHLLIQTTTSLVWRISRSARSFQICCYDEACATVCSSCVHFRPDSQPSSASDVTTALLETGEVVAPSLWGTQRWGWPLPSSRMELSPGVLCCTMLETAARWPFCLEDIRAQWPQETRTKRR